MERLRQLLGQIGAQLGVLTVSQRVAIGLCAAMIVGSLLWLAQWSAAPEMVPLVTREFSFDELDSAESALQEEGIAFETRGTRLFVRSVDRYRVLRVLHSAEALPDGSLYDMDAVVSNTSPFLSPEQRRTNETWARGNELAKIIASSPYVRDVRVMITDRSRRHLNRAPLEPSASVTVTLASGKEMRPAMVETFAKLVSGAVAGLEPHNVNVIDATTLRAYNTRHPDDPGGGEYLDQVRQHENHLYRKIMNKLAHIPGVLVDVSVQLDATKRVENLIVHGEPAEKRTTSHETSQSVRMEPTEAGLRPNTGVAVTSAVGGQTGTTEESTQEFFNPQVTKTETIEHLPFARKSVTASVSLPRSFLVSVFMANRPEAEPPSDDDPDFTSLRMEQVDRIRKSVEKIVMADSPDDVIVDVYPDVEWGSEGMGWKVVPGNLAAGDIAATGSDPMALVRGYGPQAGMGFLALMSLFLMMRVVRKSSPVEADEPVSLGAEQVPADEGVFTVGPFPVGEAAVSAALLAGREVGEETLRYEELGTEVAKMVESDPSATADLLRRWIDDSV